MRHPLVIQKALQRAAEAGAVDGDGAQLVEGPPGPSRRGVELLLRLGVVVIVAAAAAFFVVIAAAAFVLPQKRAGC